MHITLHILEDVIYDNAQSSVVFIWKSVYLGVSVLFQLSPFFYFLVTRWTGIYRLQIPLTATEISVMNSVKCYFEIYSELVATQQQTVVLTGHYQCGFVAALCFKRFFNVLNKLKWGIYWCYWKWSKVINLYTNLCLCALKSYTGPFRFRSIFVPRLHTVHNGIYTILEC